MTEQCNAFNNPLLSDCSVGGDSLIVMKSNSHMAKVLDNEEHKTIGRTPSSELLSNLATLRVLTPIGTIGKRTKTTLKKVIVLGAKSKHVTCTKCKEPVNTVVRESVTTWILPVTIGVFAISMLIILLLDLSSSFKIAYCIGGLIVVAIVYLLSSLLNGKNRHFCPKCNAFIGFEKDLIRD